jgi:hypothetical protein
MLLGKRRDLARSVFLLEFMAVSTGFEPVTFGLGNRCSILLSYETRYPCLAKERIFARFSA